MRVGPARWPGAVLEIGGTSTSTSTRYTVDGDGAPGPDLGPAHRHPVHRVRGATRTGRPDARPHRARSSRSRRDRSSWVLQRGRRAAISAPNSEHLPGWATSEAAVGEHREGLAVRRRGGQVDVDRQHLLLPPPASASTSPLAVTTWLRPPISWPAWVPAVLHCTTTPWFSTALARPTGSSAPRAGGPGSRHQEELGARLDLTAVLREAQVVAGRQPGLHRLPCAPKGSRSPRLSACPPPSAWALRRRTRTGGSCGTPRDGPLGIQEEGGVGEPVAVIAGLGQPLDERARRPGSRMGRARHPTWREPRGRRAAVRPWPRWE